MKTFSLQCNSDELREHWNGVAQELADFSGAPSTQYYRKSEINLIREYFPQLKGKKLLKLDLWNEVNNTRILSWISQQGAHVYGVDISDYLVKKSKENFASAGLKGVFKAGDMRDLPFKADMFDFIYTMGTIEHVHDYEKAITEIWRVLKPGGTAIVGVPNKLDPFLRPLLVWAMDIFNKYPYSPEYSFTRGELIDLLTKYKFKIIDNSGVLFMPGWLRLIDLFFYKYISRLCAFTSVSLKPFEYLERKYPWARRNGYLIACVVKKL